MRHAYMYNGAFELNYGSSAARTPTTYKSTEGDERATSGLAGQESMAFVWGIWKRAGRSSSRCGFSTTITTSCSRIRSRSIRFVT